MRFDGGGEGVGAWLSPFYFDSHPCSSIVWSHRDWHSRLACNYIYVSDC